MDAGVATAHVRIEASAGGGSEPACAGPIGMEWSSFASPEPVDQVACNFFPSGRIREVCGPLPSWAADSGGGNPMPGTRHLVLEALEVEAGLPRRDPDPRPAGGG